MLYLFAALIIAVSAGTSGAGIPSEGPPPAATLAYVRAQLLTTLNRHRADVSLPPFKVDTTAERAAQEHSEEMERTASLQHEDLQGHLPLWRYAALGGFAQAYGENLGYASRGVIDRDLLWQYVAELDKRMMAERPPDDGHRRNILSKKYEAVGIGVAVGPNGIYITEDFVGYPDVRLYGMDQFCVSQLAMMERDGL